MSKKASPMLIGVFVVAATVIAVAGVLVLGSGKFFSASREYVLHFEGNLSGLDAGAPVTFKGVRVGEVSDISLIYDHADHTLSLPVTVRLSRDSFCEMNVPSGERSDNMMIHIDRGMRAQLKSQSLVTGKLKVELDYHEDAPANYVAKDSSLPEIPTIPGSMDSLARRVSDLPWEDIVRDISASSKALSDLAESGKLQDSLDLLNATLADSHKMMSEMNKGAAPFRKEVLLMVEELSDAARSAQFLMDYLERHPESLIHGKGKE